MASKLCLVDASGYIHRAFHAIPPLSTSRGEPVNAIYGFSRMMSKALKEEKPDYLAICFDTGAPTFRHESFVEYKANRAEMDKTLAVQFPLIQDLVQAWGLPDFRMDGFEADDIIATLARYGLDHDCEVVIFSGDKDMLQLVKKGVRVKDEMKKADYDEAKVQERYGIQASQLLDYFSLIGDKVDNVPGVPGVGEKTAQKLIQTYGSLEKLFKGMNGESANLKEKLEKNKDNVYRNRMLIKLKDDVPMDITMDDLKLKKPEATELETLLKRLEFKGELFGMSGAASSPSAAPNSKRKIHVVMNDADLKSLKAALSSSQKVAYDLETDGLDTRACNLVGVSLSVKADEGWYIPVGHNYVGAPAQLSWDKVKSAIATVMEDSQTLKIGQNIKFDNSVLARLGLEVQPPFFDTMIAAYAIDPGRNSFGLKELAAEILQEQMTRISELIGRGKEPTFATVPIEAAAPYAGADAEVTLRLFDHFEKKIKEERLEPLFYDLEMPLVRVIQEMENAGIAVDRKHLEKVGERFKSFQSKLEKEIYELAGEPFLLSSPKQLSRILFEKLKLPPGKKTKTGYSTDEDVLRKLAVGHPVCEKIIAFRELAKLNSTYVESLLALVDPTTSRVHTTFHQTGAVTGRLSSTDPNLQNIPIRSENGQEIRRAFVPAAGCILISADYSQIDLRVLAHMSEDPALIKAFRAGGDIHASTASEMFQVKLSDVTPQMRRSAKAINFGIVYGQQAYALAQSLGIKFEEAQAFIDQYFVQYAGVRAWIETTLENARKTGVVSTVSGRRRFLADISAANSFTRGFAERVAVNTPIQGSSADIIKYAMIRLDDSLRKNKLKTKMLVQVHDELLFEVPLSELKDIQPIIKEGMESAMSLRVPLVADMKKGSNWNDMEKM